MYQAETTTHRGGSLGERFGASGIARNGAEDGTRTRDPHLGKVMLYQLSHFRMTLTANANYTVSALGVRVESA